MQTFTPIEYLKIDIATNFGLDKANWDERISWFDANEQNLEKLMPDAEEPALYFAGIKAYEKASRGLPTGYPISLDATSSGAQILTVLIGCESSARHCNVIDTGKRQDLYTNIYQAMDARCSRDQAKEAINY